jgi:hypothetical protein
MVQKDVPGFDVSMNFFGIMQVFKATQDCMTNACYLCFIEGSLGYLYQISNTARIAVFKNKP